LTGLSSATILSVRAWGDGRRLGGYELRPGHWVTTWIEQGLVTEVAGSHW